MSETNHQPLPFYFAKGLLLRTPALPFVPVLDQEKIAAFTGIVPGNYKIESGSNL